MEKFDLTPDELESPVWKKVRERLADMLDGARKRLEAPATDHDATQAIRGEIKAIKDLLALHDRARYLDDTRQG